jgi:hypothetical protein
MWVIRNELNTRIIKNILIKFYNLAAHNVSLFGEMGKNFINDAVCNDEGLLRVRLAPFYYSGMPSIFRTQQGNPVKAIGKNNAHNSRFGVP